MRIWLDDLRNPLDHQFGDYTWVKTANECMNLLRDEDVTHISFDHDLGTDQTGYDVAKLIEFLCHAKVITCPEWRVHSANPVGAANIKAAMVKAEEYNPRVDFCHGSEV